RASMCGPRRARGRSISFSNLSTKTLRDTPIQENAFSSFFSGRLAPTRSGVNGCPLGGMKQPVALARPNLIVLEIFADQFHCDLAKPLVRIGLWVVTDRIKVG